MRAEITSGALRPGQHIVETDISEQIGISRGTLREALRSIENEGLVESDGRGHVIVRDLSADQIAEVFEVRTALETLAATKLAQSQRREAHASTLVAVLEPLTHADLDFAKRIDTDLAFHELLCRLTGNQTLISAWSPLIGQIRMMIIAAGPQRASRRMRFDDHVVIADAIRTGNVDLVRQTLAEHMELFAAQYVGEAVELETGSPNAS